MNYLSYLLPIGIVFGALGALCAGFITYQEYVHHYSTKREPWLLALKMAAYTFIFFVVLSIVMAWLFSKMNL